MTHSDIIDVVETYVTGLNLMFTPKLRIFIEMYDDHSSVYARLSGNEPYKMFTLARDERYNKYFLIFHRPFNLAVEKEYILTSEHLQELLASHIETLIRDFTVIGFPVKS